MRKVETGGEMIVGQSYWLFPKSGEESPVLAVVNLDKMTELGNEIKFVLNNIWCFPGNNQALERWDVYGPVFLPTINEQGEFEEARKFSPDLEKFNYGGMLDGDLVPDTAFAIHSSAYRGIEYQVITSDCAEPGVPGLTEVLHATLYFDNYKYELGGFIHLNDGIAECRKAIDLSCDDMQRFQDEYTKAEDPSVDSSCVAGTCSSDNKYVHPNDIPAVAPKVDAEDPTLPEFDIDEDEIPF
ncbi:MAG: hypothetical protein DRJ64_02895 [Thermoprotei archaeon]|nr:MAG: hypothetical protein DRJ64_02895 [Thermoprotei archaeon]